GAGARREFSAAAEGRTIPERGDSSASRTAAAARESVQRAYETTAQGGGREMGTTAQTMQTVDFFYSMVEHAPLAYLFVQPDGTIAYLNARGHEVLRELAPHLGAGPEQLVGRSVEQLYTAIPVLRSRSEGLRSPVIERVSVGPETVEIRLIP